MDKTYNKESIYINLKDKLYDKASWTSEYLYKFIIKSNRSKVNKIETIFDNIGAVIKKTPSKKGTYLSLSVNVVMKSPEAVIEKYKEVGRLVEGVISL